MKKCRKAFKIDGERKPWHCVKARGHRDGHYVENDDGSAGMAVRQTKEELALQSAEDPAPRVLNSIPYKVICISLYVEDLRELDKKVERLKAFGLYRANRSMLIRYALSKVAPESVEQHELYRRPE